jgi:DNA-binding MurR/RpiR family transcriptional regulator
LDTLVSSVSFVGVVVGRTQAEFVADLKSSFDTLPAQMKLAARWVIDHPTDVALLTMREQARRSGMAPATLTRLAQRFGLSGYDDIRRLFAATLRARPETFYGRAEELLARHASEGDAALVHDTLSSYTRHFQTLSSPEAIERIAAAAQMLADAEHVFCFGHRSSFSVAFIFHYIQSMFGAKSILVDGPGATGPDNLRMIGPDDVLLVVSVDPYVPSAIEAARFAKSCGARVVSITDSDLSPVADVSDHAVIVGIETPSFFHTMSPAFAVAECLAALIATRRGKQALSALAERERQLASQKIMFVTRRRKGARS